MNVDQIAELAKKELDAAEANVEYAQRQLVKAMDRQARAQEQYIDADLQRNSSWNTMYAQLVEYKRTSHDGDVLVLLTSTTSSTSTHNNNTTPSEIKKLSKWVQNQRVHYKYYMNGDTKHIKKHRIDALNKIGFIWNTREYSWNVNFSNLQSYYAKYGHYNVSKRYDSRLYSYVTNLRRMMCKKKCEEGINQKELTEERVCRLNSIHFTWDTTTTTAMKCKTATTLATKGRGEGGDLHLQFDELYTLLSEFKKAYGHVHVAKMMPLWRNRSSNKNVSSEDPLYKPEFKKLAPFLASVRSEHVLYMEGKACAILDEEKISLLTELGIKWKQPACEPRSKKKKRRKELFSSSEGNNDCKDSGGDEYDDESNDNNNGDDENIIVSATEEGRVDDDGSVI